MPTAVCVRCGRSQRWSNTAGARLSALSCTSCGGALRTVVRARREKAATARCAACGVVTSHYVVPGFAWEPFRLPASGTAMRGEGRHARLVVIRPGPHPADAPGCARCQPAPLGRRLLDAVVAQYRERYGRDPTPWARDEDTLVARHFALVARPCPVCGRGGRRVFVGSDPARCFVVAACGDAFGEGPGCGHAEVVVDETGWPG